MNHFSTFIVSLPSSFEYTSDVEYRNHLRRVFRFDPHEKYTYKGSLVEFSELDPVTQDELLFDNTSMSSNMDILMEDTMHDYIFQEIYMNAAARMFSTDVKIGQAVACSYDTFNWYFTCCWHFYVGGVSAVKTCSEYKKLKNYFI